MAKIGKLFDETPKVIKGGKLTPEELRERRNEQSRAKRARDKAKKAGVPPPAPAQPPPPKEEIKLSIEEIKPPPKAKRTKMTPEELKARRNEQTRKYREAKKKAQAQAPAPTPEPPTPEPSPTSVVDAPYGYTASGRIRKKPIKETTERRDRMPSRSVALQEEEKKKEYLLMK